MRVHKPVSLLEVEVIVCANDCGTALMSNTECAWSAEVGACSRETPKSDATWLLNAGYGGITTGWRSTSAIVCSAGDEVDAITTVAVRLGWFAGVGVVLAENVAALSANTFSGIRIISFEIESSVEQPRSSLYVDRSQNSRKRDFDLSTCRAQALSSC